MPKDHRRDTQPGWRPALAGALVLILSACASPQGEADYASVDGEAEPPRHTASRPPSANGSGARPRDAPPPPPRETQAEPPAAATPPPGRTLTARASRPPAAASSAPPSAPAVAARVDDQLSWAPFVYNRPPRLPFKRPQTVQLVIETLGRGTGAASFEGLAGELVTRPQEIRIAAVMSATLTGAAEEVQIVRAEGLPEVQRITTAANPTWAWHVTAQRPGEAVLNLTVYAHLSVEGERERVPVKVLNERIVVETDAVDSAAWWIGRIDPIWKWLIGVAAVLGSGFVWWRRNVSRRPAEEAGAAPASPAPSPGRAPGP